MFYLKLAINNIKQSFKVFAPFLLANLVLFILTGSTLVILNSPMSSENMQYGIMTLNLAIIVLVIFAVIMSLYSYNFLLKQRSKEFGLYNILGMNKRKVGLVATIELFLIFLVTAFVGSILCAVFSNFFYLIFARLIHSDKLVLTLTPLAFASNIGIYAFIFLFLEIAGLRKIGKLSPLALFADSKAGEKEPRGNIIFALLGIASLGFGYYLSLSSSKIDAVLVLFRFFIAVLFVIAGTYLFYISFIAWYLKRRRKNKKYFYQPEHFITVSQMIFRMKQNAVGLANITLLAVMAFVTIATTSSLYTGSSQLVSALFPKNTNITLFDASDKDTETALEETILKEAGLPNKDVTSYKTALFANLPLASVTQAIIKENQELFTADQLKTLVNVYIITQEDYRKLGNDVPQLAQKQTALYMDNDAKLESLDIQGLKLDNIKNGNIDNFPEALQTYNSAALVVSNDTVFNEIITHLAYTYSENYDPVNITNFIELSTGEFKKLNHSLDIASGNYLRDSNGEIIGRLSNEKDSKEEVVTMYGGFLFTGFLLGISFLLGAALIIYYKQYSEGHEDKKSYTILQEVGMDKSQVKKTINSQVILVFFMPIVMAIIHFLAALTMLKQMLLLFGVMDNLLIYSVSAISIIVIMMIYFLIYKITSKTYYKIIER